MPLGFQLTRTESESPANVLHPPAWWRKPLPAWAQAAAAVVIFAAWYRAFSKRVYGDEMGDLVRSRLPDSSFIVRPGLVVGPGDPNDRFGYWPLRIADGGEVLALVADGRSNPEIARTLYLGEATVKTHLLHVFEKLGVTQEGKVVGRFRATGIRPKCGERLRTAGIVVLEGTRTGLAALAHLLDHRDRHRRRSLLDHRGRRRRGRVPRRPGGRRDRPQNSCAPAAARPVPDQPCRRNRPDIPAGPEIREGHQPDWRKPAAADIQYSTGSCFVFL